VLAPQGLQQVLYGLVLWRDDVMQCGCQHRQPTLMRARAQVCWLLAISTAIAQQVTGEYACWQPIHICQLLLRPGINNTPQVTRTSGSYRGNCVRHSSMAARLRSRRGGRLPGACCCSCLRPDTNPAYSPTSIPATEGRDIQAHFSVAACMAAARLNQKPGGLH
jgi:hypothetical protein